jgi:hypothetical protein
LASNGGSSLANSLLIIPARLAKKSAEFPLKKDRFYFTFIIFKVGRSMLTRPYGGM